MNVYIWTSGELKNDYIGEYVEQTYTITNVPNDNSNKYVNIAKSWYTVQSVTIWLTSTDSWNTNNNTYFRISWSNNTTNRYWWCTIYNGTDYSITDLFRIVWRLNWATDTTFVDNVSINSSSNTVKLEIFRDSCKYTINWSTTTHTYETSEQNVVQTIMNSSTINAYVSRQNWCTISDVTITVTYTPNS